MANSEKIALIAFGSVLVAFRLRSFLRGSQTVGRKLYINLIITAAIICILFGLIVPRSRPLAHVYFDGKHEFEWINQLWSPSVDARQRAVIALGELLQDDNCDGRLLILTALGDLGKQAKPAIKGIRKSLEDEDPAIRRAALKVINKIETE